MLTKQVLVVRKDLKMRRGKECAQAAHASMAFMSRKVQSGQSLNRVELEWLNSSYAKVCVRVNSESELMEIDRLAREAGLECHLVTDSGRTEFDGVPTRTCLAIGPDLSEKIDKVTGHLELY